MNEDGRRLMRRLIHDDTAELLVASDIEELIRDDITEERRNDDDVRVSRMVAPPCLEGGDKETLGPILGFLPREAFR